MIPIVDSIIGAVSDWQQRKHELRQAKHQTKLAIENNKARLAQSEETHNHEWEMAQLENNYPWLRAFCFFQISAPFIITVISPDAGAKIFDRLKGVPEDYMYVYVLVVGAVWGISELKGTARGLAASLAGGKK